MSLIKGIANGWAALKTACPKAVIYVVLALVPILVFPISVNGKIMDIRTIREIAFYCAALSLGSFLQKNIWLRFFIIWCVINFWLHFFIPNTIYFGLCSLTFALMFYVSLKKLIEDGVLKVDTLLKSICVVTLFQLAWLLMQFFIKKDPVFYPINCNGTPNTAIRLPLVGWMGNPAVMGLWFAMTAPLFLKYFKIYNKPILFFAVAGSCLILQNATTAICLACSMLFYFLIMHKGFNKRTLALVISIFTLLVLYFILFKLPNFDRFEIWHKAFTHFIKFKPIIGWGFVNFAIMDKTQTPWKELHNDFLQVWLEMGIVGLIAFCAWLVSKIVEFFRYAKTQLSIVIATCLLGFIISMFTIFPCHLYSISFIAIIMLVCLEKSYGDT